MKCPKCGNTTEWKDNPFRPFCSERCKMIDLGAWVNDEYSVPGDESVPTESENQPPSLEDQDHNS